MIPIAFVCVTSCLSPAKSGAGKEEEPAAELAFPTATIAPEGCSGVSATMLPMGPEKRAVAGLKTLLSNLMALVQRKRTH